MANLKSINIQGLETGAKNRPNFMMKNAIIIFVATVALSCCPKIASSHSVNNSAPISLLNTEGDIITKRKAIKIAKGFVKIAYGRSMAEDFFNSEFPPKVSHYFQTGKWNVFFTNGISSANVMLDGQLLTGTESRMDGKIYKRSPDEDATIYNLPLFTLDEFKEIVKLPHNNFDF